MLHGYAEVQFDKEISGLTLDSRQIKPGYVFVAVAGNTQHGLIFAHQAIAQGAIVIVYEQPVADGMLSGLDTVVLIGIRDLKSIIGLIAARYYDQPTEKLAVVGITGTNGKTSCSHFLGQALPDCGVIGTLGWGEVGKLQKTGNTTPDAISVQQIMAQFVCQNRKTVAMEVSSHGLEQGRVNGVNFKGVIFTNISQDHLDYHGSMQVYIETKLSLLEKPGVEFAVINLDDQYVEQIVDAVPEHVQCWGYSRVGREMSKGETVNATAIRQSLAGIVFNGCWQHQQIKINVPVFGDFNVENLLAVLTTMLALKIPLPEIEQGISAIRPVAGRMERIGVEKNTATVFIDYAHTPDALAKALSCLKEHCSDLLWVVFGCGGDRDKGKRLAMGQITGQKADRVILTDDNPRSEASEDIIEDILSGCKRDITRVIPDRKTAIEYAITHASPGDCVLIAGKGHEDYQEIAGVKRSFSDHAVAGQTLSIVNR